MKTQFILASIAAAAAFSAPAMAATPSGVGEFSLSAPAFVSTLSRADVQAQAVRSDSLSMNGEIAPSFEAVAGMSPTRAEVRAEARMAAENDTNGEIAM